MAAPEVAAALISVAGSVVIGAGTTLANYIYRRKAQKMKTITNLKEHKIFAMHDDIQIHVICIDPVRTKLFTHIKNEVLIYPIQQELMHLLGNWTDRSIHRESKSNVWDRMTHALDNIMRIHQQKVTELPRISELVTRLLLPLHSSTFRSVKELLYSDYDNATLLTLTVTLIYASTYSIIAEWSQCANMLNGQLNNCEWQGERLCNAFNGSTNAFVAHVTRWCGILDPFLPLPVFVLNAKKEFAYVTPHCAQNLGYTEPSALTGRNFGMLDIPHRSDQLAETFLNLEEFNGEFTCLDQNLRTITRHLCLDHIVPQIADASDDSSSWASCSLGLVVSSSDNQTCIDELPTILALLLRMSESKFDCAVSVSSRFPDLVVFRSDDCKGDPLIATNVSLQQNMGINQSEFDASISKATQTHGIDHILKFTSLTYVSQHKVYRCNMFVFESYIVAMHKRMSSCHQVLKGNSRGEISHTSQGIRFNRNVY